MWWAFIKNSLAVSILVLTNLGCKKQPLAQSELTLYLASSLMPLADVIHASAPKATKIHLDFLSSAVIAKQIEQGAPCHAAILANEQWYEYLQKNNLVQSPPLMVASNSLVLASLTQKTAARSLKEELLQAHKVIVADEKYVPLGTYTAQVFANLKIERKLTQKLIKASSARQTVIMLEQGAAEFAVIFGSDAHSTPGIFITQAIPEPLHEPIKYLLFSCNPRQTQKFKQIKHIFSRPRLKQGLIEQGFKLIPQTSL